MAERKIIAVVGATGAQGGSLARAILDDPEGGFVVRALTRNPQGESARELAGRGAEVVEADMDDVQSMTRALQGAHGAFFVTNFWEHMSPEKEGQQAKNLAEAAKAAGVHHVVWSTLDDSRKFVPLDDDRMPTLQGKYKVPHFDAKGEADEHFRQAGVPTTFLLTTFYWENMIGFGLGPKRGEDGVLALGLPMGDRKLAGLAVEDIGKTAYGIFQAGDRLIGKTVGVAGEALTGKEMADKMSRALGEEVRYAPATPEQFRGYGFPGADDLGNMFQFYQEFEDHFATTRDPARARELNPELQDFDTWLAGNAKKIPVDAKG